MRIRTQFVEMAYDLAFKEGKIDSLLGRPRNDKGVRKYIENMIEKRYREVFGNETKDESTNFGRITSTTITEPNYRLSNTTTTQ